ncbi:MAG: hypothetical protein CMP18_00880 [Rickettsiales bacterium]|nr:hypothetical protein [Rickettsiales bacterium]
MSLDNNLLYYSLAMSKKNKAKPSKKIRYLIFIIYALLSLIFVSNLLLDDKISIILNEIHFN